MAYGLGDKIENKLGYLLRPKYAKRKSHRFDKQAKHRAERRRNKYDIECVPAYNKHHGWEW